MPSLQTAARRPLQLYCHWHVTSRTLAQSLLNRSRSIVSSSTQSGRQWTPPPVGVGSLTARHRGSPVNKHDNIRCLSILSTSLSLSPQRKRVNCLPLPNHDLQQQRYASTWLPEAVSNFSIWGGSGWCLKTIHMEGLVPYWACFAIISLLVRSLLIPVVLNGAHTSSRIAKVIPELQFHLSLYLNDMRALRKRKAPWNERAMLMVLNWKSFRGIFKTHNTYPLAIFLSPLLQLPIFWYVPTTP